MPPDPAPPDDLAALASGAAALGVALGAEQLAAFATYRTLLLEWNARFNLTAITDPAQIATRHFLDSLTVALGVPRARWAGALRLLDVGSGAGFPGLALAIAFPQWHVTALEAIGKKVSFLRHVATTLGLARVRVLPGRAEALAHAPAERGRYDVVTARAVAALPTLLEYCQPFARVGGLVLAPKKGELAAELAAGRRAAAALGGRMEAPLPVDVPGLEGGRVLVVVAQERPCPTPYPRPAGAARKQPLGLVSQLRPSPSS
ncbi:MAG TPA: 16S rRNA (guanine(527)-N(7))-methyltransferase RsmG [Ktedonobacterales bacterium]|nr:16S rRNA (guanine(527)-N(7))-methyltransferase RsmG [Ktedonobacterales bacterium]